MLELRKYIAKLFFLITVASFAVGCSTLGWEEAKTFNERAAYAQSSLNSIGASAASALNNGSISSDDAIYVRNVVAENMTLLAAAEVVYNSGDVATAEGRLVMIQAALQSLRTYLISKGVQ